MEITDLYIYPIKGLRGIRLDAAVLTRQGLAHDRRFMLWQVDPAVEGGLRKVQTFNFPVTALFEQRIVVGPSSGAAGGVRDDDDDDDGADDGAAREEGPRIEVRFLRARELGASSAGPGGAAPTGPSSSSCDSSTARQDDDDGSVLSIPLHPSTAGLARLEVDVLGSGTACYRMGRRFDEWFGARLGFPALLVYIGDGRRDVLAPSFLAPLTKGVVAMGGGEHVGDSAAANGGGVQGGGGDVGGDGNLAKGEAGVARDAYGLAFNDVAALLVTSMASVADVAARVGVDVAAHDPLQRSPESLMRRFRPNVVVDGRGCGAWDEDFWGELEVAGRRRRDGDGEEEEEEGKRDQESSISCRIALTANCGRCLSVNVDYASGRPTELGRPGANVLKALMKDRRVDKGIKWDPVFGRYGFLASVEGAEGGRASDDNSLSCRDCDASAATALSVVIRVGDSVRVSRRNEARTVWDWPSKTVLAATAAKGKPTAVAVAEKPSVVGRASYGRPPSGRVAGLWRQPFAGVLGFFVVLLCAVMLWHG